jgi:transcriptional regulator with XRE-family HTH domain
MRAERHCRTWNLWATMKGRGQTMAWLARSTGVSRSMLYRMKNGDRTITEETARRIAVAMGLPFDGLFFFTTESTPSIENRSIGSEERVAD